MTQDRDDYMRRQEADHDLLRMRGSQAFGRGLRPTPFLSATEIARLYDDQGISPVVRQWQLEHRHDTGSHVDWLQSQPPSPAVHQALLELDDPCDDCAHWLWYIEVQDVMSMPPDQWVKLYNQEWNCS